MRNKVILAEVFCGMAGLSFWYMRSKPPISWLGSKVGYAETIAMILGIERGDIAGFVWGDCGPNIACLASLAGATGATAEDVAAMLWVHRRSHQGGGGFAEQYSPATDYHKANGKAGWHNGVQCLKNYEDDFPAPRIASLPLPATKAVAALIRSWKNEEPRALWERLKAKGWPSLLLPEGSVGRWLGPASVEDVAEWIWVTGRSFNTKGAQAGFLPSHSANGVEVWNAHPPEYYADAVANLPRFPPIACWQGRAEDLVLPADLTGIVCFMDPPYKGDITTGGKKPTGYKAGNCSRESVLAMARDYDKRGAVVAICESVRLDRELGAGWYAVDISHARRGQARTFTKNQGSNSKEPQEWVTLNRPPAYHPPKQIGMFG